MGMQCAYRNELQWCTARTCRSLSPFSFTADGSWLDCAELQPTRRAFKYIEIQWLSLKTRGYSIMYPQNMWNGCDQFLTAKAFSTKGSFASPASIPLAFNLWLGPSTSFTSSCNSWKSQQESRLQLHVPIVCTADVS